MAQKETEKLKAENRELINEKDALVEENREQAGEIERLTEATPVVDQLTDAEMSEALGPLNKQLRSLVQIQQGISAYFQAKEEVQGLIARRDALVQENKTLQENFETAKLQTAEELRAFREEAKNTREADIRGRKDALNAIEEEIREANTQLGRKRSEIGNITNTYNRRFADLDKSLGEKQKDHAVKIAAMDKEEKAAEAELERVKGVLATFLKEHGLAPAVPIETAPAENVLQT